MPRRIALPAKLTRPRMHAPLLRERVFRQLDAGRDRSSVLWVDGPPGSGKTTAVATWLEERRIPFHWYQADPSDEDPATVFYFLAELATRIGGPRAARLPPLSQEHLHDLAGFTHRFFRQFLGRLPEGGALVFDNLHEVQRGGLLDVLREAIGECPHGVTLVFISRQPVPPALVRLAACEEVLRVGWETLRFQPEESRALMALRTDTLTDATAVHARSGGWAAGLVLLSAQAHRESRDADAPSVPGPTVFDYFAGEILDRASETHRSIMLRTALLPEVSRDTAIALTGQIEAPDVLEDLHRRQYFTDHRGGAIPTWRYHDLFREFLLTRLAQEVDAQGLAALRRRAAALLATTGSPDAAVVLYRQVGDWAAVAPLIRENASALYAAGRWQTLSAWFEGMPETEIRADPWVLFWWASCRVMVDPRQAQTLLTEAFDAFVAAGDDDGAFSAALAQAEVVFVLGESFRSLDRWIDSLAPLLEKRQVFPSVAAGTRAWTAFVDACIYRRLGHPLMRTGVRYLHENLLSTAIDDTQRVAAATVLLGYAHFCCDEPMLREVLPLTQRLTRREEIAPVTRAWAGIWITVVTYMLADFERCIECAVQTADDARRFGLSIMEFVADIYRSYSLYQLGRRSEALALDEALMATAELHKAYTFSYVLAVSGLHQVYEGNDRLALEQLDGAFERSDYTGFEVVTAVWRMLGALPLAGLGRRDECLTRLEQGARMLRATTCTTYDAMLAGIDATCRLALGERESAVPPLRVALDSRQPWKKLAKLCWLRHSLPQLFSIALHEGIEVDLVNRLIREWRIPPASPLDARWPWPLQIRALGTFDVQIDGAPLPRGRKAPKRLLELLKALVALGGREVPLHRLADAMFPDQDADVAEDSLRVSLQRLRKLLGADAFVVLREGRVSLAERLVWVDVIAFQQALVEDVPDDVVAEALMLHAGPLLDGDDSAWVIAPREKLRSLFLRQALRLAERHAAALRWDAALDWYGRCADADALNESFVQGALRCCTALGRTAEGETAYRRLETALASTLGRAPADRTRRALQALLAGDRGDR